MCSFSELLEVCSRLIYRVSKTWAKVMKIVFGFLTACLLSACAAAGEGSVSDMTNRTIKVFSAKENKLIETQTVVKADSDWKKALTAEQYYILRHQGTERAFSGKYDHVFDAGIYVCAACGNDLFVSDAKFDSGCGWPAFFKPVSSNNVEFIEDGSHGMVRTEVRCARCGSHLGHVFDDGPPPTHVRFCINSGAIELKKGE
jgi:peptide-methionine (R)-S-oxide reductase